MAHSATNGSLPMSDIDRLLATAQSEVCSSMRRAVRRRRCAQARVLSSAGISVRSVGLRGCTARHHNNRVSAGCTAASEQARS